MKNKLFCLRKKEIKGTFSPSPSYKLPDKCRCRMAASLYRETSRTEFWSHRNGKLIIVFFALPHPSFELKSNYSH